MKKVIVLLLSFVLILSACSNSSDDDEKKTKKSNQNTNSNVLNITKEVLEYSYTKNDIHQMNGYEDAIAKELRDRLSNQNQSYDNTEVKKSVEDLKLYKQTDTKKLEVVYIIKVKSVNDTQKNIDYNEHFGKINYKKEDNKFKINNMREITNQPYE